MNVHQVLPAAQPAGRSRDRPQQLLEDRLRASSTSITSTSASTATSTRRPGLFARYSFRYSRLPAQTFPDDTAIAEGRVIEENHATILSPNTPRRCHRSLLTTRIGFARTLFVFNNQGLGFKPSSLGLPARSTTRPLIARCSRLRREQLRVPRRQRSPLQRVHELSGAHRLSKSTASTPSRPGSTPGCCASTCGRHEPRARSISRPG